MRIDRVQARAFGPLADAELEFGPGMNVVAGANESGKSSWFHAIALALCGMRRGRGKTKAERELEARYRPWTGDAWEVGIRLALDAGDELEIQRDFAGRRPAAVVDGLGRDRAEEITREGAPDGAALLGLTRQTAPAVLLVGQADILAVRSRASALQEIIQRAAATGGGDATAEAAIAAIDGFRRERIGTERQGGQKPVQRAALELRDAEAALESARRAQREHEELCTERDALETRARDAEAEAAAARAEQAGERLRELENRLREVEALAEAIASAQAPPAGDDGVDAKVADALSAYRACPEAPEAPASPEPRELESALTELPAVGDGAVSTGGRAAAAGMVVAVLLAVGGGGATAATSRDGWGLAIAAAGVAIAAAIAARRIWIGATRSAREARRGAAASRKQELEALLAASRRERARYEEIQSVRERVREELADAARACGVRAGRDIGPLVEALATWQHERRERRRESESARDLQARHEALLAGSSVAELSSRVRVQRDELARLSEAAGDAPAPDLPLGELEDRAASRRREADAARGAAERSAALLPNVTEAEERAERARRELARLRCLDAVLQTTRGILEQARDATHRDLAPALAGSVSARVSRVTGGRYREVRVDPADLAVRVRDASGAFRDAHRLSHGTAEQIYLLLRAALAEHLVTTGERAPLVLDDVTVHADAGRKRALLELLLELAEGRQIVLFSQEQEVLAWARERLEPHGGRVVLLDSPGRAAAVGAP